MNKWRIFSFPLIACVLFTVLIIFNNSEEPEGRLDLSPYPLVYLRDGVMLHPTETLVELIAVGDVMLGRGAAGESGVFSNIAPWLRAADLAFANLECVISLPEAREAGSLDASGTSPYRLIAPPSAAAMLSEAGFDLLSLANNHSGDGGLAGITSTITHLEREGITALGAGPGSDSAYRPILRQVNGVKLAFLAFNAVPVPPEKNSAAIPWDLDRALQVVQDAAFQSDAVFVSMHWGYEYQSRSDPAQRMIAAELQKAGADVIVGHHPHVLQELEFNTPESAAPASLFAYSLGNFVFDQQDRETGQSLALRIFLDREGLRAVQVLPVQAGLHPNLQTPDQIDRLLEAISPGPALAAFTCNLDTCLPTAPPDSNLGSGVLSSSTVDLTGDQMLETVRLENGHIQIEQDHALAWSSPSDWQVLDFAVGDPNLDGRSELLLALMKPDAEGSLRSHPFIIGYRRGIYQDLWGGSAVSAPIAEVELGDVDGDGNDDLLVLEEHAESSLRTLSVWRWHGWGFSQIWRSPPDDYTDLRIIADARNNIPTIVVSINRSIKRWQ